VFPGARLRWAGAGDLSPDPLGFIAFSTCSSKGSRKLGGPLPARPLAVWPRLQIGARVASLRCPILRWSKGCIFPFSVSLGVYRAETGNGAFELVASGVTNDFTPGGQLSQGRADRGGANATSFLPVAETEIGSWRCARALAHLLCRCRWVCQVGRWAVPKTLRAKAESRLGELERDMVLGRGGAMLGGQGQLRALCGAYRDWSRPSRGVSLEPRKAWPGRLEWESLRA